METYNITLFTKQPTIIHGQNTTERILEYAGEA